MKANIIKTVLLFYAGNHVDRIFHTQEGLKICLGFCNWGKVIMLFVSREVCGWQGLSRKHSQELQSKPVSPYPVYSVLLSRQAT